MDAMSRGHPYLRISSDWRKTGLGVERQLGATTAILSLLGIAEVAPPYEDNDKSATNGKARPDYVRMLADIRSGVIARGDVVVAYNQDRLVCDTVELEELIRLCRERGVRLRTQSGEVNVGTADGRMSARLIGVMAKGEREKLRERTAAALAYNAATGKPHGRRRYGWDRVFEYDAGGRKTGSHEVVNDAEAAVIRDIAQRIITGCALHEVTRDLNARGVPSATGGKWDASSVKWLALRPANIAKVSFHSSKRPSLTEVEQMADGRWPPILDRDTYDQVHAILYDPERSKHAVAPKGTVHLLSRIAICGKDGCGALTKVALNRGKVYRCIRGHTTKRVEDLDAFITRMVLGRLARPDARDLLASDRGEEAARKAGEELAALRARLDIAADAFASSEIDRKQLARITAKLRPQLEQLEQAARVERSDNVLGEIVGYDDVERRWGQLTVSQRRGVVSALFAKIELLPALPTVRERGPHGHFSPGSSRAFDPREVHLAWHEATGRGSCSCYRCQRPMAGGVTDEEKTET